MFEDLDADPATLTSADLSSVLAAAHADRVRLDAAECRFLAEWDARQVWAADGALSGAAWLRNRLGVASVPARERLRVARRLRSMPLVAAAFDAGELSYEKVRLLARARTDATAELFTRDEAMLVDSGRVLDTDQFAKVVRYWQAMADAAGHASNAAAGYDGRYGSASELLDGMLKVDALLDPEVSRIFKGVLDEIVDELRRADRRDTANGVGTPERTHRQLLADAFGEMARRAAAYTTDMTSRSRTEMIVLVPADLFTDADGADADDTDDRTDAPGAPDVDHTAGETDATDATAAPGPAGATSVRRPRSTRSGGHGWAGRDAAGPPLPTFDNGVPITGDTARRLACNAVLRRAVLGAGSEILDLGRLTPVPSTAQRRAVMLRDGGCTFAGCDMPPNRCEVHHLDHYHRGSATGGPTDLRNLALVCRRHHHLTHEGGFAMRRDGVTGQVETRRPDGTPIPTRPRAGPLHPYRHDRDDPDDGELPRAS